jgi:hypothetical protein
VDVLEEEMQKIEEMEHDEKIEKLQTYTKDELYKIAQYLGVKRRFDDNKDAVLNKIFAHYSLTLALRVSPEAPRQK